MRNIFYVVAIIGGIALIVAKFPAVVASLGLVL